MLLRKLHIDNDIHQDGNIEEKLSLWPFIQYLESRNKESEMYLPKMAEKLVREKIDEFGDITENNLENFREVFEAMYHLAKGIPSDQHVKWGLGFPIPDRVFYGTNPFYNLFDKDFHKIKPRQVHGIWDLDFTNKQLFLLVLERFYNIKSIKKNLRFIKKEEQFDHYYELDIDFTFVNIKAKKDLPQIDLSSIKEKDSIGYEDVAPILEKFNLSNFIFSGFTICSLRDCQNEFITESLQDLINNLSIYKGADGLLKLNEILNGMLAIEGIRTSFYPILKLNDAPILSTELGKNSVLLSDQVFYDHYFNQGELYQYLENPSILSFGVEEGFESDDSALKQALQKTGISSYVCFPLIHNDNLVGIFEVYSKNEVSLTRNMLIQVQSFYNLMTQLANEIILSFKNELNNVILHRYTALQPAVEWKFNQVAAQYLGDVLSQLPEPEQEKIIFKEVYPFYAAIDVKDSSFLRNKSYRDDLIIRIEFVEKLINGLQNHESIRIDAEFLQRFNETKGWIHGPNLDHYLLEILSFFQDYVSSFLNKIGEKFPEAIPYLNDCRSNLKYSYDDLQSSSELFERSLQRINKAIKLELTEFNAAIQQIFPSYFESFRTDGIEYDLYMGQSITPMKRFDTKLLKEVRKQQIINIAKIGRNTHDLKGKLEIPLETTQLIFIHPNPIDISFREDERRFDVEGSYNIRYQIIKKRIDKAFIKNSAERLVKPGTISIVYSRNQVSKDLKSCLAEVSALGYLFPEYEEFELENLQGVSDLKAIRVKIKLDNHL